MIDCLECGGVCCKQIAVIIDKPRTKVDFQDIRWYLYHKSVSIFIDMEDDWYVCFDSRCEHLDENGRCKIYEDRPPVCKYYYPKECEVNTQEFKEIFKTVEDYDRYLKKISKKV